MTQIQSRFQRRARAHLPTVILTLLSIVQALALELLWTWLRGHDYLYAVSLAALVGWVQVVTTFVGIVLIWQIYVSNVVRFRWSPRSDDLMLPFVIGLIEFTLVDTMGPDTLWAWFVAHAVVFAVMTWVSQTLLKRARMDGANDEYFRNVRPARLVDFAGPMFVVGTLLALGAVFAFLPGDGAAALLASLIVLGVLVYQSLQVDHYYRVSQSAGKP